MDFPALFDVSQIVAEDLLLAPHGLGAVIDGELLAGDMAVETEHVAEVIVVEFDKAS